MACGVGIVVALLAGAGCGSDDDDAASTQGTETDGSQQASTTTGAGGADVAAYCAAAQALVTAPQPDLENTTDEQATQAVTTWARDTMQPLVAQVEPTVPDELQDAFTTYGDILQQLASGDIGVLDSPDLKAAGNTIYSYDLDHCGWNGLSVTATEYRFAGLPTTLPAGVTGFGMTNNGTEVHEMVVLRKNAGVTQSFDQILALPQDQAMQMVTQLNQSVGPLAPGDLGRMVADLTPGDYLALCFIPTGTTSLDTPAGEGPPHFTQGMVAEFTVPQP